MTTATLTPQEGVHLRLGGVIGGEWKKMWSVKSTWIIYLIAAAFALTFAGITAHTYNDGQMAMWDNPMSLILGPVSIASILIAILAILTVTGEYGTGSIRPTMTAVPGRLPVVFAKAAVNAVVVFVFFALVSLVMFYVFTTMTSGTDIGALSLRDDQVLSTLFHYSVASAYYALLGVALGFLLRNTAGAITFFVAVVMILPDLARLLPWEWVDTAMNYAPAQLVGPLQGFESDVSMGAAYLGIAAWLIVAFGFAGLVVKQRDV
ncbi:ABC transporter permease [Haloglycomyces albus]|uniref:ABC transporter permease n=1 Tax=Haloglycomyces albus TaxID=526067 RepID=UPI00046D252B|nr:ABC transporter permease [Haloglycomyces albus]